MRLPVQGHSQGAIRPKGRKTIRKVLDAAMCPWCADQDMRVIPMPFVLSGARNGIRTKVDPCDGMFDRCQIPGSFCAREVVIFAGILVFGSDFNPARCTKRVGGKRLHLCACLASRKQHSILRSFFCASRCPSFLGQSTPAGQTSGWRVGSASPSRFRVRTAVCGWRCGIYCC